MKNIILTFCLFVAAAYAEFHFKRHKDYFDICLEENHLSADEFQAMLVSNDPRAGCIYACYLEKRELMIDGEINENRTVNTLYRAADKLGDETVAKLVSSCKTEADTVINKCEKAMKMKTCTQREIWKLNHHHILQREQNFRQCLTESGLTMEQFQEMRKSLDSKAGCVIACAMEKNEELADGKFDLDNIIKNMQHDIINRIGRNKTYEILSTCANGVESVADKCDKAVKMCHCKHKEFIKIRDARRQYIQHFAICLAQNHIKAEKYEELRSANDPKVGDVLICTMERSGEYKDGKIDKEKMLENTSPTFFIPIGKGKYRKILEACVTEGEAISTKNEMVLSVKNCIRKRRLDEYNNGPKTK